MTGFAYDKYLDVVLDEARTGLVEGAGKTG